MLRWLLPSLALHLAPREAGACVCQTSPTRHVSIWPRDAQTIPRNSRFWVWLPQDSSWLRQRAASGTFPPSKCEPGDPLCAPKEPDPTHSAARWPHRPSDWPASVPLHVYLLRWPDGAEPVQVETSVQPRGRHGSAMVVTPGAPLQAGGRYAIALGPTPELACAWSAYRVSEHTDLEPPSWDGPSDLRLALPGGHSTCDAGGEVKASLASLREIDFRASRSALLELKTSWDSDVHLAVLDFPQLVLGGLRQCNQSLVTIPTERPFSVRVTPLDAAGNRGQTHVLTAQRDGTINSAPDSSPEFFEIPRPPTAAPSASTSAQPSTPGEKTGPGWLLVAAGGAAGLLGLGWWLRRREGRGRRVR